MKEEKEKIPVLQEKLKIGKRSRETGVVQVRKTVHEREEVIDEPLLKEEVELERVPINQYVDQPVSVREENGVLIVPVMEEVLVVEKRLLLKEELHVIRRKMTVRNPERVVLKSEEAVVESSDK